MKNFVDKITELNDKFYGNALQPIIMILILFTGILLTCRTKFLQVRKFGYSFEMTMGKTIKSAIKTDKVSRDKISPFAAFSAAVAGTVGTGNIVGVTTALVAGGPGAIFWMWVSAFFGMVTNYSENLLGIYFRHKDENGEYHGGAMYYIVRGIGKGFKWLAIIFAAFAVLASIGFNFVQANSISNTISAPIVKQWDVNKTVVLVIVGVVLAILAGLIIIGGIKRISTVTSYLVPFMALAYMILALIIILMNVTEVPSAFKSIFTNAFSIKKVAAGFLGYQIMRGLRYGIARGIFSNEAGLGSSVMAHSSADVVEPVHQGLWGIFEVFLDTFIICTLTALVILTTGALGVEGEATDKAMWAFKDNLGIFGKTCFIVILPIFAFTTLVSWSYYGEIAITYLFGKKARFPFKVCYIVLTVVGASVSAGLVWGLADTFNVMMAIPNLIALVILSGLVAKITKNHLDRRNGKNLEAMLSYDFEQNEILVKELEGWSEVSPARETDLMPEDEERIREQIYSPFIQDIPSEEETKDKDKE